MRQKKTMVLAVAAALTLCAWTAPAQDTNDQSAPPTQAKELEAVTVTGSHIRSVEVETSQPVYSMSRQAIQSTGLTNLNDVLQTMPSLGTPDITPQDTLSNGADVGGRYVDIRNLGSTRTLVLVNGHRWSTSLSGLTDLSTIPISLVERIDVLKDGASSVYGSDAIGGVVNIITRDRFNGAEVNAYYGQNQHGDGQQKNMDFTWGHTTRKSSFVLSASYQDQQPMWDRSRALTRYPYGPRHPNTGLATGPWGRVTDPLAAGTSYVINHGATQTADLANYHLYDPSDAYNANQDMTFRAGSTLKNLYLQERYRLTDDIALHGSVNYSGRNTSSQLSGYPFSGELDPDNPYNPFPGYTTDFYRRTVELPRITWANSRLYRAEVGAEGNFTFLDHDWNWDADYTFAQNQIRQISSGNLYLPNVQQAMGPTALVGGQLVCADPAARAAGCMPWNVLAGPGGTPASLLNYLNYVGTARQQSQTDDIAVNVGGGLFDGPGGTVNIAGGLEHRREKGYFTPDPNDTAGLTTNLASEPTQGRYDVNEAYLELDVPLLRDLPGAQQLGINVASRYSHYSSFGSTVNNKYSVRWRPIEDLLLRGTYAQGFRAPTLSDLYSGMSQSFETFLDPCDSAYGAAGSNPAVAGRCATAGVPAHYRQLDQNGVAIDSNNGGQTPIPFDSLSNPKLKPETSVTRTFGLVYSPHYVDGLDITLDYYDIRLTNAIQYVDASQILNFCYVQNLPEYCGDFGRNSNGSIAWLNEGLVNLGGINTTGYDFGIHYRLPETSFGQFRIASDSSYLTQYQVKNGPGAPTQNLAGYMYGQDALYRLRSNFQVDWGYRQFGASWTVRYYAGLKDTCFSIDPAMECRLPDTLNQSALIPGVSRKGSVAFHDAQFRYTAPWKGVFSVGVNNLFNKKGPYYYSVATSGTGSPPYNPSFDVDRFFYLQYSQKFDL